MKRTFALSVFFHACFFTAALLWSSHIYTGEGRRYVHEVISVSLSRPGDGYGTVKPETEAVRKTDRIPVPSTREEKPEPVKLQGGKTERVQNNDLKIETAVPEKDSYKGTIQEEEISVQKKNGQTGQAGSGSGYENEGEGSINVSSGKELDTDIPIAGVSFHQDLGGLSVSGPGGGKGAALADIVRSIRDSIERKKTYPLAARRRGTEGVVHVGFRITPQGGPEDLRIIKSSGSSMLDKATVDIVKKAAPFPYVDADIEIPVVFRLD
jgi:protein TonB